MIFMCFLARSSRTTGPKIRVPIGSWLLLTSTAAFESKRIVDPSGRWMSFAVRTITALWTSPFLTRPRGAASLTETTMMSPTPAKRRLEPPSTLMHWTRLAPLLSATSRLDCIWIIDPIPSSLQPGRPGDQLKLSGVGRLGLDLFGGLLLRLGLAHRLLLGLRLRSVGVGGAEHAPGLELGDRPRLLDADDLAFLVFVALVVGVILLRPADDLAVERVLHPPLDADHHGLVGLVGHDGAGQDALGHSIYSLVVGLSGPQALSLKRSDPGDGAAHLADPRRLLDLVGRRLEAQVELLALQLG